MIRKDRNTCGEGVGLYIQNRICLQRRDNLCDCQVEIIWEQLQLPYNLPIFYLLYEPTKSNVLLGRFV